MKKETLNEQTFFTATWNKLECFSPVRLFYLYLAFAGKANRLQPLERLKRSPQ
jgi:hypothetical protein